MSPTGRRASMPDGRDAALLFDFNGVIVDDEEQHRATLESLLAEHGIPLTREQYYADYLGWNDRMSFVIAFRQAGRPPLEPARLDDLVAEKTRRYGELIEQTVTFVPGARDFVERAAGQFRLGIVSGALRHEIEHVLDTARLRRHFEVIVAADDVTTCKPDPTGYLTALATLEQGRPLSRARCLAIEDS